MDRKALIHLANHLVGLKIVEISLEEYYQMDIFINGFMDDITLLQYWYTIKPSKSKQSQTKSQSNSFQTGCDNVPISD